MDKQAMRMWNAGLTVDEAMSRHNVDVASEFAELESKIGCRSLTVAELTYGKIGAKFPQREETEEYKQWKGTIGAGKLLREVIKGSNGKVGNAAI